MLRIERILPLMAVAVIVSGAMLWASWTTPRTWSHNEVVDEVMLNTDLRDNLNALTPATSTIVTTGTQTALPLPDGRSELTIFANNATLLTIQGIVANETQGYDGQRLQIISIGAGDVDLAHQNTGALAAYRLINFVSGTTTLPAGVGQADFVRDNTTGRWRMTKLEPSVSAGLTLYSTTGTCPAGWTEYTTARGRYVVGLPSGGTSAGTDGTALTNLEDRPVGQHTHSLTMNPHTHSLYTPNAGGGFNQLATTGGNGTWGNNLYSEPNSIQSTTSTGTIANAGSVTGTNAPYVQLIACQKQ